MPVSAPELGLDREWQRRVLSAVGNYGVLFERHLGKGSRLKLDRGLNANQSGGGRFCAVPRVMPQCNGSSSIIADKRK